MVKVEVVQYLHSRPVLHRDIAARNCLYGDCKVVSVWEKELSCR